MKSYEQGEAWNPLRSIHNHRWSDTMANALENHLFKPPEIHLFYRFEQISYRNRPVLCPGDSILVVKIVKL